MFQVKSFGSKGSVHCTEIVGLLEGPQEGSIIINCQNFIYILQKILIKLVYIYRTLAKNRQWAVQVHLTLGSDRGVGRHSQYHCHT